MLRLLALLVLLHSSPSDGVGEARGLARRGAYEEALDRLEGAAEPAARRLAGEILLELGRHEEARAAWQEALRLDPVDAAATLGLARLAELAGDGDEAARLHDQVIETYRTARTAGTGLYLAAGRACAARGRGEDAHNLYEWALEEDLAGSLRADILAAHGDLCLAEGRVGQARPRYEEALRQDETHPAALLGRARAALAAGSAAALEAARADLEAALGQNPRLVAALELEAELELAGGRLEEAEALARRALEVNPRAEGALAALAARHRAASDEDAAAAVEARALGLGVPESRWRARLAALREAPRRARVDEADRLAASGRYREAAGAYAAILAEDPGRADALAGRAAALAATGEAEAALEDLGRAVALVPDDPGLRVRRAEVLRSRGRDEEADAELARALELAPDHLSARVARGLLLLETGRLEEGREALAQAAAEGPAAPSPEDRLAAGRALEALHQLPRASEHYVAAIRMDASFQAAHAALGDLYLGALHFNDARATYERLLAMNADHVGALLGMAGVYLYAYSLGTERYDRARECVTHALEVDPSSPEARVFLAELAMEDRAYDAAQAELDRALAVHPRHVAARALAAACARMCMDEAGFEAHRSACFAANPRSAAFYDRLASALAERYQFQDAVDLAGRAVELDPLWWDAYHTLALNLSRVGDEASALKVLRKVRDVDSFNVWSNNLLTVLEVMESDFVTEETEHCTIRIHRDEAPLMLPYVRALVEDARTTLGAKYGAWPEGRVLVEVFNEHAHFSARSVGLPNVGALGVCFGRVVTIDSPRALPPGTYNWARTLWHELAHVATLTRSGQRVTRWLTEGLSVHEEQEARPDWDREMDLEFLTALHQGRLAPMAEIDSTFTRPRWGGQVLLSYYQGSLIARFVEGRWGPEALLAILDAYRAGGDTASALAGGLGLGLEAFDAAFLEWCRGRTASVKVLPPLGPEGLERLKREVEESPTDARARAELARAYIEAGRPVDAELHARKALALGGAEADGRAVLGLVRLAREDHAGALGHLEAALAGGTRDAWRAWRAVAACKAALGDRRGAVDALESARALFGRDPSIYKELAGHYQALGDEAAALRAMEAYVAIDSDDLEARLVLADHYRVAGEREALARVLAEANTIDPAEPRIHLPLGDALRGLGRLTEAVREYEAGLVLGGTEREALLAGLVETHLALGELDRARSRLTEAEEAFPGSRRLKRLRRALGEAEGGGRRGPY
ncbi:MAG: tetratricopeptide repeat protein [Planctomycetes bacterium]|nr:tetratricopeptide repeat protein [Planctomycetota bacterium]